MRPVDEALIRLPPFASSISKQRQGLIGQLSSDQRREYRGSNMERGTPEYHIIFNGESDSNPLVLHLQPARD